MHHGAVYRMHTTRFRAAHANQEVCIHWNMYKHRQRIFQKNTPLIPHRQVMNVIEIDRLVLANFDAD